MGDLCKKKKFSTINKDNSFRRKPVLQLTRVLLFGQERVVSTLLQFNVERLIREWKSVTVLYYNVQATIGGIIIVSPKRHTGKTMCRLASVADKIITRESKECSRE